MKLVNITYEQDEIVFRLRPDGPGPDAAFALVICRGIPAPAVAEKLRFAAAMLERMDSEARGSGRTTRQLCAAPLNAFYVVRAYAEVHYAKQLLRMLQRDDVSVITRDALDHYPPMARAGVTKFVIDHGADLTLQQRENLQRWEEHCKHVAQDVARAFVMVSGSDPVA